MRTLSRLVVYKRRVGGGGRCILAASQVPGGFPVQDCHEGRDRVTGRVQLWSRQAAVGPQRPSSEQLLVVFEAAGK